MCEDRRCHLLIGSQIILLPSVHVPFQVSMREDGNDMQFNYTREGLLIIQWGFCSLESQRERERGRAIDNEWGTAICLSHTVAHWARSLSKCAWQTPRAGPSPARHTNPFRVHRGRDKIWAWPIFSLTLCLSLTTFIFFLFLTSYSFSLTGDTPGQTCKILENSWYWGWRE